MNEIVSVNLNGLAASLDLKQVETIEMLLEGSTSEEIREKIGVTPTQITKWNNSNPEFRAALAEAKKQSLAVAIHESALVKGMETAIATLLDVMKTAGLEKDRVFAAKTLANIYKETYQQHNLADELADMKDQIENLKSGEKAVADIVQEPYKESEALISVPIPKGEFNEPV